MASGSPLSMYRDKRMGGQMPFPGIMPACFYPRSHKPQGPHHIYLPWLLIDLVSQEVPGPGHPPLGSSSSGILFSCSIRLHPQVLPNCKAMVSQILLRLCPKTFPGNREHSVHVLFCCLPRPAWPCLLYH